jgi:hypothetical protein
MLKVARVEHTWRQARVVLGKDATTIAYSGTCLLRQINTSSNFTMRIALALVEKIRGGMCGRISGE